MIRILAGIGAVLFTALAIIVTIRNLPHSFAIWLIFGPPMIVGAFICIWIARRWDDPDSRRLIQTTLLGGARVGILALIAGMVLPVVFSPKSNTGPMLGIFFTGPLGFLVGMVVTYLIARRNTTRVSESLPS